MTSGIYKRRKNTLVGKNPNSRNGWKKGENYTGMARKHHSQTAKQKMSNAHLKNPVRYWLGRKRNTPWMNERKISEKTKQKMSDFMSMRQQLGIARYRNSRGRQGTYDINGKKMFFRSLWEVNYALYLDFLIKQKQIKKWEFEIDTFWFEKIRRGVRSYKPDFKVFKNDNTFEYHEVKGWMDAKSKTKLKRMAKYYPEIKLILIEKDSYYDIRKKIGKIAGFYE